MVDKNISRFDIWLVNLDPTIGSEIQKTRPCVIISPDEMLPLKTIIAAPMTSKGFPFPTRIKCSFEGKKGLIVLDQLRAVDKKRLVKKLGKISKKTQSKITETLQSMFAM